MPAAITHKIHAEKVLNEIKTLMNIELDQPSFLYGAQGPDIFFTHRFMPWMKGDNYREYGTMLHNAEPNKVLAQMRNYITENNSVVIASYFLGFIAHYSLDSTCHPYINFIAKEQLEYEPEQTMSILHCESEAALDAIVYRNINEDFASTINIGEFFNVDNEIKDEVSKMYIYLLKNLFNIEITYESMIEIIDDAQNVYSWLYDKLGIKKFFLNIIEGSRKRTLSCHFVPETEKNDFDYGNFSKTIWKDIQDKEHEESFLELLENATKKATEIIGNVSTKNDDEISDNASF